MSQLRAEPTSGPSSLVSAIMASNIDRLVSRADTLATLESKAAMMEESSKNFAMSAKKKSGPSFSLPVFGRRYKRSASAASDLSPEIYIANTNSPVTKRNALLRNQYFIVKYKFAGFCNFQGKSHREQ